MDKRTKGGTRRHAARHGNRRMRLACAVLLGIAALMAVATTAQAYVPGAAVWLRTQGTYLRPAECYDLAGGPGGTIVQTGYVENQAGTNRDILVMKTDAVGRRLFTQALGGRQNRDDGGSSVASDRWGDVFVAGIIGVSNANPTDLVVVKYGPTGKRLWVRTYDGPAHLTEYDAKLTVDAQGAVYVAATSYCTAGAGPAAQTGIVLMKFDAGGHRKWLLRFDPVKNTETDRWLDDMTMDGAGNLYLCGAFSSPPPAGTNHLIAYRVDANGHVGWGRTFSAKGTANAEGYAIAVRGARVAVGGEVWRPGNHSDMLLVGYDLAGNQKFAFSYHTSVNRTDWVNEVVLDPGLNAYLTGMACVASGPSITEGFMTLKVDPRGRLIWGRSLGPGQGRYMRQDSAGNIFVAGHRLGSNDDWETVSFSPRGVQRWLRTWNGPGNSDDDPRGLVLSGADMLFVGGCGWGNDPAHGAYREAAMVRYNR